MMHDLEIRLENKPGTLALMGEILGQHGISLEGGGVFYNGNKAIAHFLMEEAERARVILEAQGVEVVHVHPVLIQKLRQDVPGQLGTFCRQLADAGLNILTQYSDHANQLIVVVDDFERGQKVSQQWMQAFNEKRPK